MVKITLMWPSILDITVTFISTGSLILNFVFSTVASCPLNHALTIPYSFSTGSAVALWIINKNVINKITLVLIISLPYIFPYFDEVSPNNKS